MGMPQSVQGLVPRGNQAVTKHAARHTSTESSVPRQRPPRPLVYWKPIAAAGIVTLTFMVTVAVAMRSAAATAEAVTAPPGQIAVAAATPKPQPVVPAVEAPAMPVAVAPVIPQPEPVAAVVPPIAPDQANVPPVEPPSREPVVFADVKPFENVAPAPPQVVEEKPVAIAVVLDQIDKPRDDIKVAQVKIEIPKPKPGCENFGTFVDFVRSPKKAMNLAKEDEKLVFLLHVSGNFEDDGFTWNNAQALRVNALAKEKVGNYLNTHFVSSFQKVATFQIAANKDKQGGNVASYFCMPDGSVLHAIAGPVSEDAFLREVRWVNETHNMAVLENQKTLYQRRIFFRKAHYDRLAQNGHMLAKNVLTTAPATTVTSMYLKKVLDHHAHGMSNQDKVHLILTAAPLAKVEDIYHTVFEKILNEKISTKPVNVAGN